METAPMTLTDDEVRERLSAYHDGELPPGEADAVRARLDASPALAKEYDRFRALLGGLGAMASDPGVPNDVPKVDLLAGVQQRLYKRSAGRFYRSRYARIAGIVPVEAVAAVVLVMLIVLYVCLTYISGLRPAESTPAAPTPTHHAL